MRIYAPQIMAASSAKDHVNRWYEHMLYDAFRLEAACSAFSWMVT